MKIEFDCLSCFFSIAPFSFESQTPNSVDGPLWTQEFVPLGAIALFASSNQEYHECVNKFVSKANLVYQEFLISDEGKGFNGQVWVHHFTFPVKIELLLVI